MAQSKRTKAAPQRVGKKPRKDPKAATEERARHSQATIPVVVFAGRTEDPEGVGEELIALLGGRSVAVRKGIRKTGEVPPRYAITDVIELVKGPGNAPEELGRLRSRYPEVFAKEVGRVRERHGDKITFCDFVRFRDSLGRASAKPTAVATLPGVLDMLLLLPGKVSAALRSQVVDLFVRFVGGAAPAFAALTLFQVPHMDAS